MNEINQKRKYYLDYLRVLSSFAVIVLHVSVVEWCGENVDSLNWIISNLFNSAVRFCVPVFAMISGALFLGRNIAVKDIFGKYIKRLAIAYVFWASIYSAGLLATGYGIERSIQRFFEGESHLWYIYMICGMYLVTPFLHVIVKNGKLTRYFLALSFTFSILIPYLLGILERVISQSWYRVLFVIVTNLNLKFVMGFSFYYVLGYYLDANIKYVKTAQIVGVGILGAGLTVLLSTWDSLISKTANDYYLSYMSLNVMLEAVCVFTLFKNMEFNWADKSEKYRNILLSLSQCSFGVYLVHPLIIKVLLRIDAGLFEINPCVSIPIISFVVFTMSYIVSKTLNKIPFFSKYLV